MRFFDRRPLFGFALSFYVISCVLYSVTDTALYAISAIALIFSAPVFIAALLCKKKFLHRAAVLSVVCGIALSAIFCSYNIGICYRSISSLSGSSDTICARIESIEYTASYGGYYVVGVTESERGLVGERLLLSADNGELYLGDTVLCEVELCALEEQSLTDDIGARRTYLPDGVVLFANGTGEVERLGEGTETVTSRLSSLRSRLCGIITSGTGTYAGGFLSALFLGSRAFVPATVTRDFRALGISHLLALSGTHLTVLFSGYSKRIRRTRKLTRVLLGVFPVLFYMALTGFSPSVSRAGLMFIMSSLGNTLGRGYDPFTGLGCALILICAVNPWAPYDIGLLLSAAAMLSLLLLERRRMPKDAANPRLKNIVQNVLTAFFVPLMMLPLMWLLFGEVSLVSAPANLVLAPFVTLFIPATLVLIVTSPFPKLFLPLARIIGGITDLFLGMLSRVSRSVGIVLPLTGAAIGAVCVMLSAAAIFLLVFRGRKARILSLACVSLSLVIAVLLQMQGSVGGEVCVCYEASGKNDAVCASRGSDAVLFDIGNGSLGALKSAVRNTGSVCGRIDAFVLTHLHKRHISTVYAICETYYVRCVYIPIPETSDEALIAQALETAAIGSGTDVEFYSRGDSFSVEQFGVTVSEPEYLSRSTHPVISFSISFDCGMVSYLGASAAEQSEHIRDTSDSVCIFGGHGPVTKAFPNKCDALSVASVKLFEDVSGLGDAESLFACVADSVRLVFSDDHVRILS